MANWTAIDSANLLNTIASVLRIRSARAARRNNSSKSARGKDGKEVIDKLFPPEFRNRLDAWINFKRLDPQVIEQVVDKLVSELEVQLQRKRVSLTLGDTALKWLAKHGYNSKFGARPMGRLIDKEIRRKLADEVLFGGLQDGGSVTVNAENDALTFVIESSRSEKNSQSAPPETAEV